MESAVEQGMTRQHTFFCINQKRHTCSSKVIEAIPKEITVFGKNVKGWLVTTEEPAIDNLIPLEESLEGDVQLHAPE